jgi:hypothetical protein
MSDIKTGRNDLCLCGSGKKYKKCCYLKAEKAGFSNTHLMDVEWQRTRKTEGEIIDKFLMPYVAKSFGKDVLEEAWNDFINPELKIQDDQIEMVYKNMFIPWFLFNWVPLDEDFGREHKIDKPIAAILITTKYANNLTEFQRNFILEMLETYYSFYVVLDVVVDYSLVIKDLLLGSQHMIKERMATRQLQRGSIIFSRILNFNEQSIFVGMAPLVAPSQDHHLILDYRDELVSEYGKQLDIDFIKNDYEFEIRSYFFDLIESSMNQPMPTMRNTDGDQLEPSVVEFDLLISIEHALDKLLKLSGSTDKNEILQDAKYDVIGTIAEIKLPWLKLNDSDNNSTLLGHIVIQNGRLKVEVNSQKRGQQAIAIISRLLGESANYVSMTTTSMEDLLENFKIDETETPLMQLQEKSDPQLNDIINELAAKHWKKWFDENIPMLNNQTPRQAAKTEEGKERLEALFLHYEDVSDKNSDNLLKPDINYLRKELGM